MKQAGPLGSKFGEIRLRALGEAEHRDGSEMKAKQYFQCRLRRGDTETIGWIEARGAKVGASVELLPSREWWEVTEVYEHGLPEEDLKKLQSMHRRSLPSIKPID